ncbi:MAG: MscS Mechanosensitive ion channel [Modestobacter sp.]|nr:MscS Mechanosensitive ion channel [Modestobacter sp.]
MKVLQVTDAVGAVVRVRVRVLVSAKDGPTLFDLRCHVREGLVVRLQREHPTALPKVRNEGPAGFEEAPAPVAAPAHTSAPAADGAARPPEGLVTGSAEARERSRAFTGPSEEEQAERDPVEETAGAER